MKQDWTGFYDIPPATVRAYFSDSPLNAISELEQAYAKNKGNLSVVVIALEPASRLDDMLDQSVVSLATVAKQLWPHWYGSDLAQARAGALPQDLSARREIRQAWLRSARAALAYDKNLVMDEFPRAVQVCQLGLAIQPNDLLLGLSFENESPSSDQLQSLARACQWLAQETGARVLLLLPGSLADRPELEPILYDARSLPPAPVQAAATVEQAPAAKARLWPLEGRPHPLSPGEQRLAELLHRDDELRGLFHFNAAIGTVRDNRYVVDLLWTGGRLVVEVDGYYFHKSESAFRQDRHRDYELLLTGYRVLRLTHEEIVEDAELALEKIRDLVRSTPSRIPNSRE